MKKLDVLLERILPIQIKSNSKLNRNIEIDSLEWKIEAATNRSAVFYRLDESEESGHQLLEKLKQIKVGVLFTNRQIAFANLENVVVIDDQDWLEAQKLSCDFFYPLPQVKLVGITGTNGKTTTADLCLQLADQNGLKAISIGTLGVREIVNGQKHTLMDIGLTTPPYLGLRKILYQYAQDKTTVFMEVSSHSLIQKRIYKLKFDVCAWTSFSQDHLDYHETMEKYFAAKCLIYSHLKSNGHLFIPRTEENLVEGLRHFNQTKIAPTVDQYRINGNLPTFFSAYFNRNNLELAFALVCAITHKSPILEPDKLILTEGRFSVMEFKQKMVIIDFAHTPEAIENICQAIKKSFVEKKLVILFGCGGNRDKKKRPLMGQAADKYADKIYVTSDNSRFEKPEDIINDILPGIKQQKPIVIVDRAQAIKHAFQNLKKNEILLLAGKGHESYLSINGINYPFNDADEIKKVAQSTEIE